MVIVVRVIQVLGLSDEDLTCRVCIVSAKTINMRMMHFQKIQKQDPWRLLLICVVVSLFDVII
jgi:hypothetical protein